MNLKWYRYFIFPYVENWKSISRNTVPKLIYVDYLFQRQHIVNKIACINSRNCLLLQRERAIESMEERKFFKNMYLIKSISKKNEGEKNR